MFSQAVGGISDEIQKCTSYKKKSRNSAPILYGQNKDFNDTTDHADDKCVTDSHVFFDSEKRFNSHLHSLSRNKNKKFTRTGIDITLIMNSKIILNEHTIIITTILTSKIRLTVETNTIAQIKILNGSVSIVYSTTVASVRLYYRTIKIGSKSILQFGKN